MTVVVHGYQIGRNDAIKILLLPSNNTDDDTIVDTTTPSATTIAVRVLAASSRLCWVNLCGVARFLGRRLRRSRYPRVIYGSSVRLLLPLLIC